jgi:hypothetical protein
MIGVKRHQKEFFKGPHYFVWLMVVIMAAVTCFPR